MEKNNIPLSTILKDLLSMLLHQKYESVVERSEHVTHLCVPFFKTDENRFLLKHQILSII